MSPTARSTPPRTTRSLFMHGFGLNHHQADHLIGPGKPLDTDKYFIICTDELGNTHDLRAFKRSNQQRAQGDFPTL